MKFHNGATLTADDVSFTFDRATSEDAIRNQYTGVGGLEAVDEQTFRVIARAPDAEFLETLNMYIGSAAIMPRSAADAGVDFAKEAVGTGPFTASDGWNADSLTTMVRFDDYWGGGLPHIPGTPYLDGVRVNVGDDATQVAAFAAGELDMLVRNDRVQAEPILSARPDAVTDTWPADFWYGIGFNQDREPFDDIRVRQAIHLALSRQDINAIATFGDGQICGPAMIEREGFTLLIDESGQVAWISRGEGRRSSGGAKAA